MKPGTGVNPFYERKHGLPIQNALDNVLASFCESYQPTGATNSVDAAEMLFKGTKPDFSRPVSSPAVQEPPAREYAPQPADAGSTFGTRPARVETTATFPAAEPRQVDMEWALAPGHGWTAEDSRQQLRALEFTGATDASGAIKVGFDKSTELSESSFAKSGWAAGLMVGGFVGLAAASVVAAPVVAVALTCGAMGAVFKGISLTSEVKKDHNDGAILRDMATRLHEAQWNTVGERHSGHGDYQAEFGLWRR